MSFLQLLETNKCISYANILKIILGKGTHIFSTFYIKAFRLIDKKSIAKIGQIIIYGVFCNRYIFHTLKSINQSGRIKR